MALIHLCVVNRFVELLLLISIEVEILVRTATFWRGAHRR